MTRDYKPATRRKKAPSSGSGSSLLVGILIGLLLGLAIALGVALYLNKVPGPFLSRGKSPENVSKQARPDPGYQAPANTQTAEPTTSRPEDKPRFDFYNILPGTEDPSRAKPLPAAPPVSRDAESTPSTTPAKEVFFLQAGAFQNAADADNMKARLALLGVEAYIQTNAGGDRGTFHRVRIGPFSRVDEVNRTRDTLKQNGIDSTLIKGREKAN